MYFDDELRSICELGATEKRIFYRYADFQAVFASKDLWPTFILHQPCDWPTPPRFKEDVLAALQARQS